MSVASAVNSGMSPEVLGPRGVDPQQMSIVSNGVVGATGLAGPALGGVERYDPEGALASLGGMPSYRHLRPIAGMTISAPMSNRLIHTGVSGRKTTALFASVSLTPQDASDALQSLLFPSSGSRTPALKALLSRIGGFADLAAGWDGGETVAISAMTIAAAMRAADAAARAGLPLPQASPSSEGEISLTWYRGRDRFALTIDPDNYAVWATSINRQVEEGDAVEVGSGSFPGLVIGALREFYRPSAREMPV